MKTVLKQDLLILVPETEEEEVELQVWKEEHAGHVLLLRSDAGQGLALRNLGPQDDVCRAPINITSRVTNPQLQLIGNFAETPFMLDGQYYRSVEAFWQGLKFETAAERRAIAQMDAREAKGRGDAQGYGPQITYADCPLIPGTWDHWQLMDRACAAKFEQHLEAREALVSTAPRPLAHRTRRDSKTIPGVIMADIWMKLRARWTGEE